MIEQTAEKILSPDSVNMLFYFFSTISQAIAALTALLFAAAINRIDWLDGKITDIKYSVIAMAEGTVGIEQKLNSLQTSQVIDRFKGHEIGDVRELSVRLKNFAERISDLRNLTQRMVIWGIVITTSGIIAIFLVPLFSKFPTVIYWILAATILGIITYIWNLIKFINEALIVKRIVSN